MMDIDVTLTSEQQRIQQLARDFTAKHIIPVASKYDETGEFPEEILSEALKVGLFCPGIPEEYGGSGYDLFSQVIVAEEIGYGCGTFGNILSASMPSMFVVLSAGTEEQKKMYFSHFFAGGLTGFSLTEPGAGSDAGAVATTAHLDGDEWVLNGTKCFATLCGYNSIMLVIASTEAVEGAKKGLSAFIVEKERKGLTVGAVEHKLGLRASNSVELILKDVRIPKDHLVGKVGEGLKYALQALDDNRLIIAAISIGMAQRSLDEAIKYCKEYIDINGKPLSAHQTVAFKLADMATQIESARQLIRSVVRLHETGVTHTKETAMAKTVATDTAMNVCIDVVGLMGSYGYSHDSVVEKNMRDCKIFQIFEGTNEIQHLIISRHLLKS
ncbi:MAG: acyl-CoA dehydrogenase family protein [Syntrophomonadaceae bacterium]|jgi:acyl-CoA dehydrogenase